jgi:abnormal spindle-like microcephaly-associated protein
MRAEQHDRSLALLLSLVMLLDMLGSQEVILHQKCLFQPSAPFKSTTDCLAQIGKLCLSGVGNMQRYTSSSLGFTSSYQQSPVDEINLHISNLAVDLRDGTRLARLADILYRTRQASDKQQQHKEDEEDEDDDCLPPVSNQLRLPAISRLQKIHNVEVALERFHSQGVDTSAIEAKDIVEGKRAKTLLLLWPI